MPDHFRRITRLREDGGKCAIIFGRLGLRIVFDIGECGLTGPRPVRPQLNGLAAEPQFTVADVEKWTVGCSYTGKADLSQRHGEHVIDCFPARLVEGREVSIEQTFLGDYLDELVPGNLDPLAPVELPQRAIGVMPK